MKNIKRNGFTLVELLSVIVILAIILAIAIPAISNVFDGASRNALESSAKMVLKAINYKMLEDSDFIPSDINETTVKTLLNIDNTNYETLTTDKIDGIINVVIIGKGKWHKLKASGTSTNIVIENIEDIEDVEDNNNDVTHPIIVMLGSNSITIPRGSTYIDAGSTANDNIDGNITANIQTISNVNTSLVGTYTVTYNVSDAAGNAAIQVTRTVNIIDSDYIVSEGVNKPRLAIGMTPIKWDTTTSAWVNTTESDTDWYNYTTTDKKWANAKTADGSFWVWIPRYVYRIPEANWHTSTVGTIDIQFTKGVDDNWNKAIIGNIDVREGAEASNAGTNGNKYTNHPAFTFGSTELTGIWVAKFEASGTTSAVNFVPNVASLRSQTINTFFTSSRNMETNTAYGWGTTGNNIDTHMMKNSEWGVAAYLAQSTYGKNAEIWINPSSDFITGCAGATASAAAAVGCLNTYDTTNGLQASTTGNIYGIYDMSGGTMEYIAAYVDNGNAILDNGSTILATDNKYKDVYTVGITDTHTDNYALTINSKGEALYETSGAYGVSWRSDFANMPMTDRPWFARGGGNPNGYEAGVFDFYRYHGGVSNSFSFRAVVLVGIGL